MEEKVAQKSSELEQYLQRVRELEEMYKQLQEALEDEKQARQDEETVRKLQARSDLNLTGHSRNKLILLWGGPERGRGWGLGCQHLWESPGYYVAGSLFVGLLD